MSNILKEVAKVLADITDDREMEIFLLGILTPKEQVEISQRLEIVKMLKKGIPQHEIAKKLGVGIATVTRGSKEVQNKRFTNI